MSWSPAVFPASFAGGSQQVYCYRRLLLYDRGWRIIQEFPPREFGPGYWANYGHLSLYDSNAAREDYSELRKVYPPFYRLELFVLGKDGAWHLWRAWTNQLPNYPWGGRETAGPPEPKTDDLPTLAAVAALLWFAT